MDLETLLIYKGWIVFFGLLLLFFAERWLPASPPVQHSANPSRWGRNLGLWALNSLLSLLIVIPLTILASSNGFDWRPVWLSGWAGFLVNIFILDLWIYWWHRANHRFRLLWRFHRVHHLDQWLDTTSAVRFHFGEVALSALFRAVVIFVFAIPLSSVVVFEIVVLLAAGFHHSNLRLPVGFEAGLSRLIITPSLHWLHHHTLRQDTDSNYGTLFSFWDTLFGSQSQNKRTPDMPIGLENEQDISFGRLLHAPFKRRERVK